MKTPQNTFVNIETNYLQSIDDYSYHSIEQKNECKNIEEPYKHLWNAVILQAITDATTNYKREENKMEKRKAISWLTTNSRDFKIVCHFAEQAPSYIIKKAKEVMQRKIKIPYNEIK